jgi:hypothetical protein
MLRESARKKSTGVANRKPVRHAADVPVLLSVMHNTKHFTPAVAR